MVRFSLFIFVLILALNMIFGEKYSKFHSNTRRRSLSSHHKSNEFGHLKGKLVDTTNDAVYNVEIKKEESNVPSISGDIQSVISNLHPNREEIACLAACHTCVEDYPIAKKRAADNCGPMCDCADSCFSSPIEQVFLKYGREMNERPEKDCWSKTYQEHLVDSIPS